MVGLELSREYALLQLHPRRNLPICNDTFVIYICLVLLLPSLGADSLGFKESKHLPADPLVDDRTTSRALHCATAPRADPLALLTGTCEGPSLRDNVVEL